MNVKSSNLQHIVRKCLTAIFACIGCISPGFSNSNSAFAASSFLEQGKNYYQRGEYLAASAALSWAIQQTPQDSSAHYYLANSFVKLGRMREAQLQYQSAINLNGDPIIKKYSQAALVELLNSPNGSALLTAPVIDTARNYSQNSIQSQINYAVAPSATSGSFKPFSLRAPVQKGLAGTSPTDLRKEFLRQRASQLIDEQADRTSAGMLNMGNQEAASDQRDGYFKSTSSQSAARLTVQDMSNARYKNLPIYSPEEIKAAQQRGDAASQDAMIEANQRSADAVKYAKAKVWETQAAAQNLQDQLNASANVAAGGAKLKVEGTNLYVRNFDAPIVDPGAPLQAVPGKLKVVAPLEASPKFWNDSKGKKNGASATNTTSTDAKSSVYGQIVK